jgi:uncharacterized protein YjbI with pentapeptide repeats
MQLKNIFGEVIFERSVDSLKQLVELAVREKVSLQSANLRSADLQCANLQYADLRYADLRSADLQYANLQYANLQYANLPSPQIVLTALWGEVSPELTADLMEYDAYSHPDRKAFDVWAKGGVCPYENVKVQRAANFKENRELWGKGVLRSPYDLMIRVLKEKAKI